MNQWTKYLVRATCLALCLLLAPTYGGAQHNQDNGNGLRGQGTSALSSSILAPVTSGGPWFAFMFFEAGSFAVDCAGSCAPSTGNNSVDAGPPPWTFSAASWHLLTVTDWYFIGDQFEIYDFGQSIGTTSSPADWTQFYFCGGDPDVCLVDPNVSHGVFVLVPGDHEITIQAIASPFNIGGGLFRVDKLFAGIPGRQDCQGKSVSAMAMQYKSLAVAAARLGFPSVEELQEAIMDNCGN